MRHNNRLYYRYRNYTPYPQRTQNARADKLRHAKVARSQKRNRVLTHARKLSTVTKLTPAVNIFSQVS